MGIAAATRDYPPGDLRVSDTDRDLALSELSEAFQVGRITAGEFDQRSGQVLGCPHREGTDRPTRRPAARPRPLGTHHRPGTSPSRPRHPDLHRRIRRCRPRRRRRNERPKQRPRSPGARARPGNPGPPGPVDPGSPRPRLRLGRHDNARSNRRTAGRVDHLPARDPRRPPLDRSAERPGSRTAAAARWLMTVRWT